MKTLAWRMAIAMVILGITWTGRLAAQRVELTGEVAVETRLFPREPLFPEQGDARVSPSFRVEPELVYEWGHGTWRITAAPFVRFDPHDDRRTHFDVRELGLLYLGNGVTAFTGVGKVFWGVTEVHHLVDVVNQTDAVEDIDDEDKLGQPMVNLTLEGGWGYLDLFYLPVFRERTFPDARGRLRGPLPIDGDASYESDAGAFHQDFALRWSRPIGAFDLGVSFFRGTSREPRFLPSAGAPDGAPLLQPRYDVIDQLGIDLQWTGSATLLKLEALTRGGHGDRFVAATGGIEYTLYRVFPGDADLGLLVEVMLDGRSAAAPATVFDNDVFMGFRWAFNDVSDTSILGGSVVDYATGELLTILEVERRLGGSWRVEFETRWFANTDAGDVTDGLKRDGLLTFKLSRFF